MMVVIHLLDKHQTFRIIVADLQPYTWARTRNNYKRILVTNSEFNLISTTTQVVLAVRIKSVTRIAAQIQSI